MNKFSFIPMFSPDGAAGGDPNDIDFNYVSNLFSNRIIAINPTDTPERDPKDPDRPRFLNYPVIDDSPIDYKGHKSLRSLGMECAKRLSEARKANPNAPAQFINCSVQTKEELIKLRLFSFEKSGLSDSPAEGKEAWLTAGITRRMRVTSRGGSLESYGKAVATNAQVPAEVKAQAAPVVTAKPATV